jgi:ribosomal protein L20A (L18A)
VINSVRLFKVKIINKIKNNQIKIIKINNINKKEINNIEVGDFVEVGVVEEKSDFCCGVV